MTDDLAVAHKDYNVRGGGEILVERLARGLDCPLVVGHDTPDNHAGHEGVDVREVAPESRLHQLIERGGITRAVGNLLLWRDHAYRDLDQFDTVITSGNEPLWWTPRDHQTVVSYTHSTPRWMYDLYNDKPGLVKRTRWQLQRWAYEQELSTPDLWVANSDLVARRMRLYWDIDEADLRVVYPPIETGKLHPSDRETGDYYLSLSRLEPTKRVLDVVETANELGVHLKVAGDGSQLEAIREAAGPTVEVLGWVSGEQKRKLLSGARATVAACRNEDFGMVPVESLAAGTPVISVAEGFPSYLVRDGENGLLFERGRLAEALRRFDTAGVAWSPQQCATFAADNFSKARFLDEMREAVAEARDRSTVSPDFDRQPTPDTEVAVYED
jgi:glycosyltransferase involved in cell wall biosynthesis